MPDIYDQLLDRDQNELASDAVGRSPQQHSDIYDSILDQHQTQDIRAAQYGFEQAAKTNPDRAAQVRALAQSSELPADVVERNFEKVQQRDRAQKIQALLSASPILAKQMRAPEFANLAHDDVENLVAAVQAIRASGEVKIPTGPTPTAGSYLRGLGQSFVTGAQSVREGLRMQFADALGFDDMSEDAQRRFAGAQMRGQMATPDFDSSTAQGIYGGFSSLLQMAPAIGASVATGSPALGLGILGAQTQTQTYPKYRGRGASPAMATLGATGEGAVEVATEMLPMGFLVNRLGKVGAGEFLRGFLGRELITEQVATIAQDAIDTAIANPDKTWGDYLAERPDAAYQTALGSLVASGVLGGANTVARRMASREEEARRSQQVAAHMQEVSQAVETSALRERAPDVFEQFLAQASEGTPLQEVFIDADTLANVLNQSGIDPAAVAQVPSIAAQMEEASLTNGMIRIPVSEFATHLAGKPYTQALVENLRRYPGAMTLAESNAFFQSDRVQELTDEVERVAQEQTPGMLASIQSKQIENDIAAQLDQAGRFTPDVNRAYAALPRAFFEVMAQRLDTTPTELYEQYQPTIVAQGVPGANVLNQQGNLQTDTPAFREWFGDSKVVDAQGKPLVVYHGGMVSDTFDSAFSGIGGGRESGFFFTPDIRQAKDYAGTGEVKHVYLSLKNPLYTDVQLDPHEVEQAKKDGYDGYWVIEDGLVEESEIVAFYPTQIKSATNNRGTFDVTDPNIFHQLPTARLATTFSEARQAAKAFQGKPLVNSATGIKAMVSRNNLDKMLSRSAVEKSETPALHSLAVANLDALFDRAVLGWSKPDRNADTNIKAIHRFFAALQTNEGPRIVKMTVKETGISDDPNPMYSVEAVELNDKSPAAMWVAAAASADGVTLTSTRSEGDVLSLAQAVQDGNSSFTQGARGAFNPNTNTIALLKNADLSSFLHEAGHFFLDSYADMAANAPALQGDMQTLLDWFGVADLAAWRAMDLEAQRAHHEKFARGFEAYLFEGRAPSMELQTLFARFRAWLIAVYRNIARLNVELNKDVRDVMDRMLATEDQIRAINAEYMARPLFRSPEDMGATTDEFTAYNRLADEATQQATDEAHRRIMADFRRVMNAERKAIREEVTAQVMAQPVYQAREFLMRGTVPEGMNVQPVKLDRAVLTEMYGDSKGALWRRLPFGKNAVHAKAGGVHPDQVAELFGFDSGDALVQAMVNAGNPNATIAALVEQRAQELFGEFAQPGAIEQAAFDELHNDTRGRFIETELAMLTRRSGRRTTPAQAAKQFAQVATARKKVRDAIKTGIHAAAEAKAARTAEVAMVNDNFDLATKAKREQLLNHYLYRASSDARTEVTKALDYLNKFSRKGTRANLRGEFLEQLDALLERFDLRRSVSDARAARERQPLGEWVQEQVESLAAVAPDIPAEFLNEGFRQHYRDLTLEEFRGLVDTVRQLEALARREQKAYMAIRDMTFEQEADAIMAEMRNANPEAFDPQGVPNEPSREYAPNLADKLRNVKDKALAEFLNVENLLQLMSDGKTGQLHDSLFGRVSERADWKASKMQEIYAYFKPLFDQYTVAERLAFSRQGHYIDSIGKSLTKENAAVVALHYGNAEGRARLQQGNGWNETQVRDIMAVLDAKDWKLIDGIWRMFDEKLWPDLEAVNMRTRGTTPPKVEPVPFDTPHGPARGGYFKIAYDSDLSERQYRLDENSAVKDLLGGNIGLGSARTRQGSSTQRLQEVKRALRLDLGVMSEAINETVHDVAFREAVADTWRVLNNKNVQNAIKAAGGTEVYRAIVQRMRETAAPPRNPNGFIEKAIAGARKNTLVVAMGMSVKTALVNVTGIIPAMRRVSLGHFARSVAQFYSPRMAEHYQFIVERSEYMRNRHDNYERDLQDSVRKLSVGGSILPEYAGWFAMISYVDKGTSAPTWMAAYQDSLKKHGNDENRAIQYADHIVRQTHGSGRIVDLASIQSGHGGWGQLKRAFTMFYSYFNAQLGMMAVSGILNTRRMRAGDPVAAARLAADVMMIIVMPAVLNEIATGQCGDEPKQWGKCVARSTALYTSGFVPIWRDVAAFGWGLLDKDVHSYGFRITPAESYFEGLARGAGSLVDIAGGEGNKTDVRNIWMGTSYLFGLPGYQVWRTVEGTRAWLGGKASPSAVLFGPPRN